MNNNTDEIVQLHLWTKRQIDTLTEKITTLENWKNQSSKPTIINVPSNSETEGDGL